MSQPSENTRPDSVFSGTEPPITGSSRAHNAEETSPSPFSLKNSRQVAFLTAYMRTGNLVRAEKLSGVSRKSHDRWRKSDSAYREAFVTADATVCDIVWAELCRRGLSGVDEPVVYRGEVISNVKKFSDRALIFMLQVLRPDVYGAPGRADSRPRSLPRIRPIRH